jgi:hypothetical protein
VRTTEEHRERPTERIHVVRTIPERAPHDVGNA